MAEDGQSDSNKTPIPLRYPRTLGILAVLMFAAAAGAAAADAAYASNHIKILIFTAMLVMTDLAAAIVVAIMWFVARHYIEPLNNNRAENEYCYRAGYRDATLRFLQPGPGLQLVRPPTPVPPTRFPSRRHGYVTTGPEGRDVS